MRARLPAIAIRLSILVAVWLLGTATFSLAQEGGTTTPEPPVQTEQTSTAAEEGPLLVPDVRGLPYVFAKGVLEDAGFAWRVQGKVEGFAVNLVKEQNVKPGTSVVDTGAPTVLLRLVKNPDYEERGLPDNASPYKGTELVLASGGEPAPAETPSTEPSETPEGATQETGTTDGATTGAETETTGDTGGYDTTTGAENTEPAPATTSTEPAQTTETTDATPQAASTEPAETPAAADAPVTEPAARPAAFVVPGAPPEPLDEIPLPLRAKRLGQRIANATEETKPLFRFWAYQHAWIVTGAKFGWWHGAEALRILIGVDETVQQRFGWGYDYEGVARAALAEVLQKSNR